MRVQANEQTSATGRKRTKVCVCRSGAERVPYHGEEGRGGQEEDTYAIGEKRANQAYSVTLAVMCIAQQCHVAVRSSCFSLFVLFWFGWVGFWVAFVLFFLPFYHFLLSYFFFLLLTFVSAILLLLILLLLFAFIFWLCSYKDVMRNDMSTIPWEFEINYNFVVSFILPLLLLCFR